jgi:uncharacterized protein (DUF2236 family)
MRNLLREWRAELKQTFTGTRDAVPEWVARLEEGDDAGYHLPGSAVWAVHGSMTTIVAGIRALLMQALHPGALAVHVVALDRSVQPQHPIRGLPRRAS